MLDDIVCRSKRSMGCKSPMQQNSVGKLSSSAAAAPVKCILPGLGVMVCLTVLLATMNTASGAYWRPTCNDTFIYAIGKSVKVPNDVVPGVSVYFIDYETPVATVKALQRLGIRVVCYFSAGTWEDYRDDVRNISQTVLGKHDKEWTHERWWNISSPIVHDVMRMRMDVCKIKGFDAVDPDCVDGYQADTGLGITRAEQLRFNCFLASEAHARNLSIGLKNDGELVKQLVDHFDFSVSEQCHYFEECGLLKPFVRLAKPVFNIEYPGDKWANGDAFYKAVCPTAATNGFQSVFQDYGLSDFSVYRACPPASCNRTSTLPALECSAFGPPQSPSPSPSPSITPTPTPPTPSPCNGDDDSEDCDPSEPPSPPDDPPSSPPSPPVDDPPNNGDDGTIKVRLN